MTPTVKAADLPEGSVVANGEFVYLKTCEDSDLPWIYMEGGSMYVNQAFDDEVQDQLDADARVLRTGYGSATG